MTSADDPVADDPVAALDAAVAALLAALPALPPATRAATAYRATATLGRDAQRRLAAAYADALAELVTAQGTYAAAAAALAEHGDRHGDTRLAAVDGEAVRQALGRARRARAAPAAGDR